MAVTWNLDSHTFVNQSQREIRATATRTENGVSRPYDIPSFRIGANETGQDVLDRIAAEFKAKSDADKTWGSSGLEDLFPNAALALKAKLEALEN